MLIQFSIVIQISTILEQDRNARVIYPVKPSQYSHFSRALNATNAMARVFVTHYLEMI